MKKNIQLDRMRDHKGLRSSLHELFPDHEGGENKRHVHGKIAIGPRGVYFVTSERAELRDRVFVVRKINKEGENTTADTVATFKWGHLADQVKLELASNCNEEGNQGLDHQDRSRDLPIETK